MALITVTDILGETREAVRLRDGSYWCPFCESKVGGDWELHVMPNGYAARCKNQLCDAGPTTLEAAIERAEQRAHRIGQLASQAEEREAERLSAEGKARQIRAERRNS
jgi:hypothetical protein